MILITGEFKEKPQEGHQIYLQGKIKEIISKQDSTVLCADSNYADFRLYKSPLLLRFWLLLYFRFPWQSTLYGNIRNVKILKGLDNKSNSFCFFYFPHTCLLAHRVRKISIFHFPDLHSYYYFQAYNKTGKLKFLIKLLFYSRAERKVLKISFKNYFLGVADSKIIGGMNAFLSFFSYKPNSRNFENIKHENWIYFRPNLELLRTIEESDILNDDMLTVVGIDKSNTRFKTISLVKNYQETISRYKFQLLFDEIGSGCSTKLIDCILNGVVPVGNIVSWRNFENIGFEFKLIFNSKEEMIKIITRLNNLKEIELKKISSELLSSYFREIENRSL